MGITTAINVQHLGIHPWDVLNVAMYDKLGLTIGSWTVIIGLILIITSLILDKRYVKLGTFLNLFLVGIFVDFFLWADFLPSAHHTWVDVITIIFGIVLMGLGGGMYNAGGVGSGPRDGFMLSISDKTGMSIGRVRILTESLVLVIGLLLGGPVFIFTFVFTFIQSPLFQFSYLRLSKVVETVKAYQVKNRSEQRVNQA
ncbi:YczE/YyaS/YitT family protein [Lentibacillus sp. JNUCC-1]|uniref:YczE/YyaS/YitT family protein n=1 Tax=Lentibacillus sp. JNUCC-1 TaxID=2654513 RepID=UPI003FA5F9F8